mmetsp:Transcript_129293/g.223432  ORF Transcript_129293/g.223432 Transcript_129293/m.223432 type:complete len:167 (-) Transcript_129293:106-606(-)
MMPPPSPIFALILGFIGDRAGMVQHDSLSLQGNDDYPQAHPHDCCKEAEADHGGTLHWGQRPCPAHPHRRQETLGSGSIPARGIQEDNFQSLMVVVPGPAIHVYDRETMLFPTTAPTTADTRSPGKNQLPPHMSTLPPPGRNPLPRPRRGRSGFGGHVHPPMTHDP